jgi:predicted nucleic acid-binding protein
VKVCPDTNCWIAGALQANPARRVGAERVDLFLTTPVLQELWAGARTAGHREYAERVYVLAWRHRRLLNPPAAAWILSGQALHLLARRSRYGPARLRSLRNDVLLAATAMVYDAAVMTHNRADFERIAEVLPVRVVGPEPSKLRTDE